MVKTSFIFVTKAEFEMYRFNVNFPVYDPKLFACVKKMVVNLLKRRYFLIPLVIRE